MVRRGCCVWRRVGLNDIAQSTSSDQDDEHRSETADSADYVFGEIGIIQSAEGCERRAWGSMTSRIFPGHKSWRTTMHYSAAEIGNLRRQ